MRLTVISLLLLAFFTSAILEFKGCPSVANSNFSIVVTSSLPPLLNLEEVEGVFIFPVLMQDPNFEYSVNFSQAQKGFYILTAKAGSVTATCKFAYASPSITTTKIPDSNPLITVIIVLLTTMLVFKRLD